VSYLHLPIFRQPHRNYRSGAGWRDTAGGKPWDQRQISPGQLHSMLRYQLTVSPLQEPEKGWKENLMDFQDLEKRVISGPILQTSYR
jgi:hypothetical protein